MRPGSVKMKKNIHRLSSEWIFVEWMFSIQLNTAWDVLINNDLQLYAVALVHFDNLCHLSGHIIHISCSPGM